MVEKVGRCEQRASLSWLLCLAQGIELAGLDYGGRNVQ